MKVLMHDNGLCTELGVMLARAGHSVGYHTPWQSAFPRAASAYIGRGLEGLIPVDNFSKALEKCDMVFCPDTFTQDWVEQARAKKKPVWGPGGGEELEHDRAKMKVLQKQIGLAVGPYEVIIGIDALIKHLQTNKDRWIKASKYRQIETFHHIDWESTRDQYLGTILESYGGGPANEIVFISEEPLDSKCEVGMDRAFEQNWLVDGWGYEKKDEAYIGKSGPLPKPLKEFADAMGPELARRNVCSFFSNEVIFTPKGPFQIEPTVRAPHPPTAGMMELHDLCRPIIDCASSDTPNQYVAVLVIRSSWAGDHWTKIEFPTQMRRWVKLAQACKLGANYLAVPGNEFVGYCVGLGASADVAAKACKSVAETVKCRDMDVNMSALDEILDEQIPNGKKFNLDF
jgi:hypothetical protein